jgi:thymidine kinase
MYLGRTLHGNQPILFDLREGSDTDKATVIVLLGSLGGGKTILLQLLLWQAFLQGARIVDIDPKGDHRFHELSETAPYTRVIKLGPDPEHAGRLDPLRVAPTDERHDAAATFLLDVLPEVEAVIHAAISGAITRVMDRHAERACCWAVVEELLASADPDDQRAGKMLAQFADAGLVRLGFAKLGDPIPSRTAEQITYLQIRALKRAAVNTVRSEMSQSQRHGRAVLQLVALYAMRILGDERNRLKVLAFDEASFLAQDAVGQQLLDTLARWGRSELAVPILSTQLLSDVTEQDNLIGHSFDFSMRSKEHARRTLAAKGLDPDGPLLEALTERYGAGRCLYRDLSGRCEEIQIDPSDPDLLDRLRTTPAEEKADSTEERLTSTPLLWTVV